MKFKLCLIARTLLLVTIAYSPKTIKSSSQEIALEVV